NRRVKLDLAAALRQVPGVASAQPFIFERVLLPDDANRTAVLIGLDVPNLMKEASEGHRLAKNPFQAEPKPGLDGMRFMMGGVLVAEDLARSLAAGESMRPFVIRAGGRQHTLYPCGEVVLQGKAAKLGGFLLVMDVRHAARALNQDGLCERIDIY